MGASAGGAWRSRNQWLKGKRCSQRFVDRLVDGRARIRVRAENLKRPGSWSHALYEEYKRARDCAEFVALGGRRADVSCDLARGFIELLDDEWREAYAAEFARGGAAAAVGGEGGGAEEARGADAAPEPPGDALRQLVAMGFDEASAAEGLRATGGDVQAAVALLCG